MSGPAREIWSPKSPESRICKHVPDPEPIAIGSLHLCLSCDKVYRLSYVEYAFGGFEKVWRTAGKPTMFWYALLGRISWSWLRK